MPRPSNWLEEKEEGREKKEKNQKFLKKS